LDDQARPAAHHDLRRDPDARARSRVERRKVDFKGKGSRELGYLELYKLPGEAGKAKYLVKTEHTRWYAEVLASIAEQVEQDLGSVVKAP